MLLPYNKILGSQRSLSGGAVRGHQLVRHSRQARNNHAEGYTVGSSNSRGESLIS